MQNLPLPQSLLRLMEIFQVPPPIVCNLCHRYLMFLINTIYLVATRVAPDHAQFPAAAAGDCSSIMLPDYFSVCESIFLSEQ